MTPSFSPAQSSRKLFALLFLPLFLVSLTEAFGEDVGVKLDEDNLRIMSIILFDTTPLASGQMIFPDGNDWMLPLAEFSESMGIYMKVFPGLSKAEGFIVEESRRFTLDVAKCQVEYGGKTSQYDCKKAVVHQEDIYVHRSLLQKWLPIDIEVDSLSSLIRVTPRERLPLQLRLERERLAERSRGGNEAYNPGYPVMEVPYGWFEGPIIDENVTFSRNQSTAGGSNSFQSSSQLGGELLGLEYLTSLNAEGAKFQLGQVQLTRRSAEGNLLGPLGTKEIRLVDISLPSMPLISKGTPVRGVLISSFPLDQPSNFESTDFEGVLQPGWEVVLYRNEVLLDRQTTTPNNRYSFRSVPLVFGRNIFRLTFFGPHGERLDEYKSYNISPDLLVPGAHHYRIGLGTTKENTQRLAVQYAQNISKYFTLSSGILTDFGSPRHFGYLGLVGVNELFVFSTNCAFGSGGGVGCEWGEQIGFNNFTVGGKYTRLFGLNSDLFTPTGTETQVSRLAANFGFLIPLRPSIGMNWELAKDEFASGTSITNLTNRLTLSAGQLSVKNEMSYAFDSTQPITGRWDLSLSSDAIYYQLSLDYMGVGANKVDFEVQYANKTYSVRGGIAQELRGNSTFKVAGTRFFDSLITGMSADFVTTGAFSLSAFLSFNLARDPREGDLNFSRMSSTSNGSASVLVFVDKNRNGVKDEDEPPMPGMFIVVNQRDGETKTNEHGIAFVGQLSPNVPTDITVSYRSFDDPFLKQAQPGVRFVPRASKVAMVNLPFVVMGGADGMITVETAKGTQPKKGIKVQLVNVAEQVMKETKTDREGIYTFDLIPPGAYTIRLIDSQLSELGLRATPPTQSIVIPEDGTFETNRDFSLR